MSKKYIKPTVRSLGDIVTNVLGACTNGSVASSTKGAGGSCSNGLGDAGKAKRDVSCNAGNNPL